jgi:hypothetical protein
MSLVAVAVAVRRRGNECVSPGEYVLIVIHRNVGTSTSGVGELSLRRRWLCQRCVWLCRHWGTRQRQHR